MKPLEQTSPSAGRTSTVAAVAEFTGLPRQSYSPRSLDIRKGPLPTPPPPRFVMPSLLSNTLRRPLWALTLLCLGALSLAAFVSLTSGRLRYVYLVWNLLLAAVPLGLALWASRHAERGRTGWALATAMPWLFFLPNAPYVLTDFIHLSNTPARLAWSHLLALAWFSFAALACGLLSLRLMHHLAESRWGRARGWIFVGLVSLLTGLGVALGRFHRWNSWDAVREPFAILTDVLRHVPGNTEDSAMITLFPWGFGIFFGMAYYFLWTLTPGNTTNPTPNSYSAAGSAGGSGKKNESAIPTT